MKVTPRIFKLEEASALLPELESRLGKLLEKKEEYARRHDELFMYELLVHAEHGSGSGSESPEDFENEIHALETAIFGMERDLIGIQKTGCILRNINKGWVDFLGKWKGEYVYFCWRRGEKSIQYYHALKGGMAERRLITA